MSRRTILALAISAMVALAACSSGGGAGAASGASAAASPDASTDTGGGYGYGATTDTPAPSAAAASGPCSASDAAGTVTAAMDGRAYVPGEIDAKVGDVIAFTNGDPVSHTATLDDGTCTTKRLGKGQTGALTFSAPGTYPFHCQVHPDMTGTIKIAG